jgi:hypothetical protein
LPLALEATAVHYVTQEQQKKVTGQSPPAACLGSAESPTVAVKGNLCIYEGIPALSGNSTWTPLAIVRPTSQSQEGASTAGAILILTYSGEAQPAYVAGSWAVSAP